MEVTEKIIVVDINYLTKPYDKMGYDDIKTTLEKEYRCKVILISSSKHGIENSNLPIYFA